MISTIAGLMLALAAANPDPDSLDARVGKAIEKGVGFLVSRQAAGGGWRYEFQQNHELGITALAGLALLENGVKRDDPTILKADQLVRDLAPRSNQTYDVALAILFLARVQPGNRGPNDELIQKLAARLADGETGGMWGYILPDAPPQGYPPSRRRRPSGSRGKYDTPDIADPVAPGPAVPLRRGAIGPTDNSNTQFALLGLWAAGRHDFDASPSLAAIDRHFRDSQGPAGDWGYQPGTGGGDAMTCAGLMGLAISAARADVAERLTARARGAKLAVDEAFVNALREVSRDARQIDRGSDVYYLWSLERVCVALGLRDLDGFDWYDAGARTLLDSQGADGSWPAQRWGRMPQTCLALLFLRKANLAFELDRVLKLPAKGGPPAAPGPGPVAEEAPPEKTSGDPGDEATVVVRQADESKFPTITVDFEVKNPDGTPKLDAREEDFRVREQDEPVEILTFRGPTSTEPRPTTVVLVVDRSQSMEEEDRIGSLKKAVATFLDVMPKGSRVAVVAFGSDVKVLCPFTDDPKRVQAAVEGLTPEGATRYYDAVATALELLSGESGRRAVLALTDGEDTFSQDATLEADVLAARKAGLPIHTLGLGSEDEIEVEALRRLAAGTRGQYFSAANADRLRGIYEELARRLGTSYSLTYRTARKLPDGTLRPIRLSYKASRNVGEAAVFIRGMVVPAADWSRLLLALLGGLALLALLPGRLARKSA